MSAFDNIVNNAVSSFDKTVDSLLGTTQQHAAGPQITKMVVSTSDHDPDAFFFNDFEAPETFDYGRFQQSATHTFMGGKKTVDLYGSQSHPIEFTGILLNLPFEPDTWESTGPGPGGSHTKPKHAPGETAEQRMQRLAIICDNGAQIIFTFGTLNFKGTVLDVKFHVIHQNRIEYTLKIEILSDNLLQPGLFSGNKSSSAALNQPGWLTVLQTASDVIADMTSVLNTIAAVELTAAAYVSALQTDPAGVAYNGAQLIPGSAQVTTLINAMGAVGLGGAALTESIQQLTLDHTNVQPYPTAAPSAVEVLKDDNSTARTNLQPFLDALDHAQLMFPSTPGSTFVLDTQFMANLIAMRNVYYKLGVLDKKLNELILPPRVIRVFKILNPNLQNISLAIYGTINYWQDIARASNLDVNTPIYNGIKTITLPQVDQLAAGSATLSPVANQGS